MSPASSTMRPKRCGQGLLLKFKPVNLDVLPLYIVLMGFFPPVLWMMLRQPDLTMLASIVLWLAGAAFRLEFHRLSRRYLVLRSLSAGR